MIYLAMFIGLAVCLLAAIKLVDLGFSHAHRQPGGERSAALDALLIAGWLATIGLAVLIVGQGFNTLSRLKSQSIYGDLTDLLGALLGYGA